MGQEIEAGKAVVRVGVDDHVDAGLDKAEARMKRFASAALAIGAKLSGLGIGLGVGLLGSAKSFATLGTELDEINQKIADAEKQKGDGNVKELAKLRKEATRLNKILGGESVEAAVKLGESFKGLKDSVSGVVAKLGAVLGPSVGKVVDYIGSVVDAVTTFIDKNRAIAPQATIIAGALLTIGAASGLLGVAFYTVGPLIRVAMIGATAATLLFSGAVAIVNTTVAVASATIRVLSGIVTLGAIAFRALSLSTIAFTIAGAAANVVLRTLAIAAGVAGAVLRVLAVYVATQAVLWGLMKVGLVATAGAMKTVIFAYRAYTVAQLASIAASAAVSVGVVALIAGLAGLAAYWISSTDAGKRFTDWLVSGFTSAKNTVLQSLGLMADKAGSVPGKFSGYLSDLSQMAKEAFGSVATAASQAFESAKSFFFDLLDTAKTTFGGVSDAIEAGNIQLAMDTLWAGLQVAWVKGCDALETGWDTTLIYIEGALDKVLTSLKLIWDVGLVYMEGLFDKFITSIRNKWQDITGFLGEKIAVHIFGADAESAREENQAQKELINKGVPGREDARNKTLANAGDEAGAKTREANRVKKLNETGKVSPELAALEAKLNALREQARTEAEEQRKKLSEPGKRGAEVAAQLASTTSTTSAQARGSAGAAGAIAKAFNSQSTLPQQQLAMTKSQTKLLEKHTKWLEKIAEQAAITVEVRS